MATATGRISTWYEKFLLVWDWPDIQGQRLRTRERRKLKKLSFYFSAFLSIATAIATTFFERSIGTTIGLSAIGVLAGHYLAGVVIQAQRQKRNH